MGGTGKTPFSIYLAKLIHKKFPEKKYVLLSRGYGATGSKHGHRVSERSSPREAGDEPLLLKKYLPFAEVWIGRDRHSAYLRFKEESKMKENPIVILDDGFQHHVLERDVDMVLLDSSRIHRERFLIPAGNLREPVSSLLRADWIVFSKYELSAERIVRNIQNKFSKKILRFLWNRISYCLPICNRILRKYSMIKKCMRLPESEIRKFFFHDSKISTDRIGNEDVPRSSFLYD